KVTPEALQAAMRQIRLVLLEADVQVRVVKPFIERVRERALGAEVMESLTPAQQVIKGVRDELTALLGEEGGELRLDGRPAVILLCGLQGSGKTTTAGKLARRLKARGRQPLLVAGDLQRAAAAEQLRLGARRAAAKPPPAAKPARRLRARGRQPLLVAGDLQRAAAVEQLQQVGRG